MLLADGTETMSLTGKSNVPRLPHRLHPLAPDRTAVECEWLFSREAVESDGFHPSYASDFWDITNRQDWRACEGVQRGVSSRGYRQGPLSPREDAVYQFITMVARGYIEGEVSRPADLTGPQRPQRDPGWRGLPPARRR